jgi:S-methylmethionine-dependent homocysteine/selenocysteine methylase
MPAMAVPSATTSDGLVVSTNTNAVITMPPSSRRATALTRSDGSARSPSVTPRSPAAWKDLDVPEPTVVIDGGLSTALVDNGCDLDHPLWTARSLTADGPGNAAAGVDAAAGAAVHPIVAAHLAFLRAGARVLITASYQASRRGLMADGCTPAEADAALARTTTLARDAVARFDRDGGASADVPTVRVGASVGPFAAVLADGSEYRGHPPIDADALVAFHRERLDVLVASRPDLLVCETLAGAFEASAIADALGGRDDAPPAWVSFTCATGARTFGGDRIEDAVAAALAVPGIEAVGINCTAPGLVTELLERARAVTELPFVVYPNRGRTWDTTARSWRGASSAWPPLEVARWVALGTRWVGGCCGVGPADIAALADHLRRCG